MTGKEKFDIRTMRYFVNRNTRKRFRITKADEEAMAALSSRGVQPKKMTTGLHALVWAKTMRDENITSYRRDIALGFFTKFEIINSYPKDMQDWIAGKIADVPYDVEGKTGEMLISYRRRGGA
jgi:hypothetical protein